MVAQNRFQDCAPGHGWSLTFLDRHRLSPVDRWCGRPKEYGTFFISSIPAGYLFVNSHDNKQDNILFLREHMRDTFKRDLLTSVVLLCYSRRADEEVNTHSGYYLGRSSFVPSLETANVGKAVAV